MDHRATSLQFLASSGLIPVKVIAGQKDPLPSEWDPRKIAGRDHSLTLAELSRDDRFNIGALFHGRWVDIDIDTTNPFVHEALDIFLPPTPYIWGRKSKPRSHRVYSLFEAFDRGPLGGILSYLKKLVAGEIDEQSYSIEVRGGTPENGLYTVLPGSYRSDVDEFVLWDREIDPTVSGPTIKTPDLIRAIRLALVTAMIAPHWVEGVRNDMSLALAGLLWRVRNTSLAVFDAEEEGEIPADVFILTEDDAKQLFRGIMRLAQDDKNDERSRLLNLSNTWAKLDSFGTNVTGGKVLAELLGETGPKIVKKIYRLLSDSDTIDQIEQLSEQYVIWYGQGLLVDLDLIHTNHIAWMTRVQATNSMGGENIRIGEVKVPKVNLLFGTKLIGKVYGLTFDPTSNDILVPGLNGSGNRMFVNQWQGFQEEPCSQRVTAPEVEKFTDYIKDVIADGDEKAAEWVFSWLADIFQSPANKPGTALVLVGSEGAGKSFLGEHIIGPIVGKNHYIQVQSTEAITDKFNTVLDNKLFVLCDESKLTDQRADAAKLRGVLTSPTIWIEPKGINRYEKPSHMRILFTSNKEHNPLFISSDRGERRFTVLKVSNIRVRDRRYWNDMLVWTSFMRPKVMRWLMDYKYDPDFIRVPYDTPIKREIQRVGLDIEVTWLLTRLGQGFPIGADVHKYWYNAYHSQHMPDNDKRQNTIRRDVWPDRIMMAALEDDYRDFVRGFGKPVYSGSINTTIRKIMPPNSIEILGQQTVKAVDPRNGQVTQTRIRIHTFPTTEEIINYLKAKFGSLIEGLLIEYSIDVDLVGGMPPEKGREF